MNNEWLQNLKAGDEVIQKDNYNRTVLTVSRTTKTQIIVTNSHGCDDRFNKSDGYLRGDRSWSYHYLVEATPELLLEVRNENRVATLGEYLSGVHWAKVSLDDLEKIHTILNPCDGT